MIKQQRDIKIDSNKPKVLEFCQNIVIQHRQQWEAGASVSHYKKMPTTHKIRNWQELRGLQAMLCATRMTQPKHMQAFLPLNVVNDVRFDVDIPQPVSGDLQLHPDCLWCTTLRRLEHKTWAKAFAWQGFLMISFRYGNEWPASPLVTSATHLVSWLSLPCWTHVVCKQSTQIMCVFSFTEQCKGSWCGPL